MNKQKQDGRVRALHVRLLMVGVVSLVAASQCNAPPVNINLGGPGTAPTATAPVTPKPGLNCNAFPKPAGCTTVATTPTTPVKPTTPGLNCNVFPKPAACVGTGSTTTSTTTTTTTTTGLNCNVFPKPAACAGVATKPTNPTVALNCNAFPRPAGCPATTTPVAAPAPTGPAPGTAWTTVASNATGKCIGVLNQDRRAGAAVVQNTCNNGRLDQSFVIQDLGGFSLLKARHSNLCLGVANGSLVDGAPLVQMPCNSADAKQQFVPDSGQPFRMVVRHSNKCIDIPGGDPRENVQVQQWTCDGSNEQLYRDL